MSFKPDNQKISIPIILFNGVFLPEIKIVVFDDLTLMSYIIYESVMLNW